MVQVTLPNANEILKAYLESHGISQTFVAKKIGMSVSTFNGHLNGHIKVDADFAFRVAKVLDISPSIFLKKSYRDSVEYKGAKK